MTLHRPVYCDYQATTPLDPGAYDAMRPFLEDRFGNPHSVQHAYGRDAETAVESARAEIAALLGADPREIIFTSGATESNNLAIKGAARFTGNRRRHIVTVATEHKCVLESAYALEREGFTVTVLPVQPSGLLDLETLSAALTDDTVLVSVMGVNNEIGVIQPLAEIGGLCRARGVLFHTDCAQAAGKIPLDVDAMAIDLMSLSSHKMYGPKGIGALYVRRRPRVRLEPLMSGGGQERGLRSGTLPAFLCVGFGAACTIASGVMDDERDRLAGFAERLKSLVLAVPGAHLNGDPVRRWPGNLNVAFPGIDAEALLVALADDIAASTGSACTSASVEPSYVLGALGLDTVSAAGSIRLGLGRQTTREEVDFVGARIAAMARELRATVEVSAA
ncbi:MAG: aminotransferase class V-fold PLP-dependent enzyme [Proteobacteria bacterium]|nr:aminotransferase class V-fold PLP-dependent enzyme [Pseudomonadota bacterium]MDA1058158.1 aminotransferase class V-fold PLP-dependent enzyme [Pseudomonadota bacterium]